MDAPGREKKAKEHEQMTEKEAMQDVCVKILKRNRIKYIHIPNSVFQNQKLARSVKHLKYAPDIFFPYGHSVHLYEFGIKGRHPTRKQKQLEYMTYWKFYGGCFFNTFYTQDDMLKHMAGLGLT